MNALRVHPTYIPINEDRQFLALIGDITNMTLQAMKNQGTKNQNAIELIHVNVAKVMQCLEKCTNTTKKEYATSLLQRKKIAFIRDLNFCFLTKSIDRLIAQLFIDWYLESILDSGKITQKLDFSFASEDFLVAKADEITYLQNNHLPLCHDFVFYHLNEIHAFPHMFDPGNVQLPCGFFKTPFELLRKWGYFSVDNPTIGDLVIFVSTIEGKDQTTHSAIFIDKGTVLSKWGGGEVYEHSIDYMPPCYGIYAYFFRKKVKSEMLSLFLREVDSAYSSVADFSHPACFSPLTAKGCAEQIFKMTQEIQCTQTFSRSCYNEKYNLKVQRCLFSHISAFTPTDPLSKAEFLGDLKKQSMTIEEMIPIRIGL